MKILIVGSSVLDKIIFNNRVEFSPGGIYHSVLKMTELKKPSDIVSLCTLIDSKSYEHFEKVYEFCNEKFFTQVDELPNVTLDESNCCHRKETYSNKVFPLSFERIDFNDYDGILINMITGYELDADDLSKIRSKTKALIYFDVHTLSRKSKEPGLREFNLIPDFDNWAKNIDIVQVNNFELFTLFNNQNEIEVAEKLFPLGVKILIVTKGEKGATIYFKKDSETIFYFKSAKKISDVNTIGCGDYFGSSFFYKYLISRDEITSLNFAINEVEKSLEKRLNAT
jgi:hypothetical protein